MKHKHLQRATKPIQDDRNIQLLEEHILLLLLLLEKRLVEQEMARETKQKKNWVDWTIAIYSLVYIIVALPTIIPIIITVIAIFHH